MNKTAVKGFFRGLGAVLVFSGLSFVGTHIGESGLVSGSSAALVTGLALAFEHLLTEVDPGDFAGSAAVVPQS